MKAESEDNVPDISTIRAALKTLLHGLVPEQRAHAADFLLKELEWLYTAAGRPGPSWIGELRFALREHCDVGI